MPMAQQKGRFVTMKRLKLTLSFALSLALIITTYAPCFATTTIADTPQLTIDATQNEGVYSPNVMGNMFEWASDFMNGSWAQKVTNRNFEIETLDFYSSPLYDHFSGNSLDTSKWAPYTYGSADMGSIQISDSHLIITGVPSSRFGVLSKQINEQTADVTIKVELSNYIGTNAMVSLNSQLGDTLSNNIEFGIDDHRLKIFGDGIEGFVGDITSAPTTLKIVVGHVEEGGRTLNFYANNTLVHTVSDFDKISNSYKVFLYGWGSSTTTWDSISIYKNELFDEFDSREVTNFTPHLMAGSAPGTITYDAGKATIIGGADSRYGLMSQPIKNSSTNWVGVEAEIAEYSGTNALININGSSNGTLSDFIEFGVENNHLVVYTASGRGNWSGQNVSFPCKLRVELSPYYANGRNIRFYYNNSIVYALWENKEVPEPDYSIFLYGYSNSTSVWNNVYIYQEHFTDIAGPNFEGGGLPNDWEISSLNHGAYGHIDSHDGVCTITGAAGSRFGVGCMAFEFSDNKPYRVVSKINSYFGTNAILHITTTEPHGSFDNFIEFGIEGGKLKVFTPTESWTGDSVSTPARLTVEISPYGEHGRNITFICNGEPVYYLENTTALPNSEFRLFLYGYGNSVSAWDYADAYPIQSWQPDGVNAWGKCEQEYSSSAVSGNYMAHISIEENNGGSLGISHGGISITGGHAYQLSMWLKSEGAIQSIIASLGGGQRSDSSNITYAQTSISNVDNSMKKYVVTLVPDSSDADASLYVGGTGTGDIWIDQISLMPLDTSEASYGGWRTDFVESLRALDPGALRWPGGILSDWYDWEEAVGAERDHRNPLYFAQWNATWMSNDVGIDEFLQLCEALDIDPVINVNYATSTATHAADFVEYVNGDSTTSKGALRAANGRTAPYDITWWEIGNETWGSWVPNPSNDADFAKGYKLFYDAMTAVDPKIMCIGEGGDGNSYNQDWNRTVLNTNGNIMDEISIHYYSPQNLPAGYSDIDVFKASVAAPLSVGERLKSTQNIISETGQDIKIAVTEYNAMYFNSLRHRTRSMEAALQVAGLLNTFFEYPGLTDHNDYSCLTQFWDGSSIRLGNEGTFYTPSYYVLQMYSTYRGEMKIKSTLSSPAFSNTAIGDVPAMSNVPYLDTLVTRSLDGSKIYIAVVNRDNQNSYNLPITVDGANIAPDGVVRTVAADNYLDANSWVDPNKITIQTNDIVTGTSFTFNVPKLSVSVIELNVSDLTPINGPVLCGEVRDCDGSPIPDATILLSNGFSTTTNAAGYYEMPVESGTYWVDVSKDGYSTQRMDNIYVYALAGTMAQPIILPISN